MRQPAPSRQPATGATPSVVAAAPGSVAAAARLAAATLLACGHPLDDDEAAALTDDLCDPIRPLDGDGGHDPLTGVLAGWLLAAAGLACCADQPLTRETARTLAAHTTRPATLPGTAPGDGAVGDCAANGAPAPS